MNTVYFIVQQTMIFAIPLLVVSLGGLLSEKSGISNIALEGIMIIGGFVGVLVINALNGTSLPNQLLLILAVMASGLAGGIYSALHAWASIRLKAEQTISGIALNLFAPAFCIFTARAVFGAKSIAFTDTFLIRKVPVLGNIPVLGPMFFTNCYLSNFLGILLLLIVAFVLAKMRFGMRLSACGENPDSAASVGISVAKMRYCGVLLSGVLGGIGGIIFIIPTSTSFSATVSGYGFLALAVLILGQWNPVKILLSSFFFGLLKALSSSYSGISFLAELPVKSEIYKMIPYVLTLCILAISSGKSRSPKALGVIYDDGKKAMSPKKKAVIFSAISLILVGMMVITVLTPVSKTKENAVSNGYGAEIALVIDNTASVDDKGYMQSIWEAIVKYTDRENITRKYYQAKDNSAEGLKKAVEIALKGNAKFVILGSNIFENTVWDLQNKYPDISFIMFDGEPINPSTGEVEYAPNTLSISFAEEESGFLAGYSAVKDGYRNLGFIGGMAFPSVIRFGYGFLAGCEYASKELNLNPGDIKIKYNYAGSFSPNPESQAMASAWYNGGVEVIFACAGGLGDSIMKSAENCGKYVIQVDQDKSADSETVITSAMKDISTALSVTFDNYKSGELKFGTNYCLTAKENCVMLPMNTSRFNKFSQEDYDEIYEKLASGLIHIQTQEEVDSPEKLDFKYVVLTLVK